MSMPLEVGIKDSAGVDEHINETKMMTDARRKKSEGRGSRTLRIETYTLNRTQQQD
jgi:hypothetical protein